VQICIRNGKLMWTAIIITPTQQACPPLALGITNPADNFKRRAYPYRLGSGGFPRTLYDLRG
jgi:hypothetical protein